jgi:hypothetical protein
MVDPYDLWIVTGVPTDVPNATDIAWIVLDIVTVVPEVPNTVQAVANASEGPSTDPGEFISVPIHFSVVSNVPNVILGVPNDSIAPDDVLLSVPNDSDVILVVPNNPPTVPNDLGVVLDVPIDPGVDLIVPSGPEIVLVVPIDAGVVLTVPIDPGIVLVVPINAGVVLTVPFAPGVVLVDPNNPSSVSNVSDVILGVRDNLLPVFVPLRPINLIVDGSLLHIPPLGSFFQSVYFIRLMVCPHLSINNRSVSYTSSTLKVKQA